MTKKKMRKLAAFALSVCMASGVGAAMAINVHTHFAAASADTAKYAVTEAETYSAKVSQTSPAIITLTGVTAGQYSISAKITEVDGEPIADDNWEFYDLVATVGGESLYLNYDFGNRTFNGVIRVESNDTLTLTTTTASTLTLSVTVDNLSIGANNDYTLSNVKLIAGSSQMITLDNVAASDYKVIVDLGTEDLIGDGVLYAQINDGTRIQLIKDSKYFTNTYVGTVTVGDMSKTLTITSTNAVDLNATIMLNQVMTYAELPSSVDLEMWVAKTYKYTAAKTGYYSLNTSSTDSKAEVSITFKTDAEAFEGLNVTENNFPLYMEANETYYFEFVLMNSSNDASATINTAVVNWDKPTIETNVAYPVPVTAAGRDRVTMDLVAEEGEYNLSLIEVPYNWYWNNITVTAYVGGEEIALNADNSYTAKIFLDGNTTISLTTNAEDSTVLTLSIATPEVMNYIKLGVATEVTVPAATMEYGELVPGNIIYYIENAQAGYYGITLSANNNISIDANWLPAVFKGNTTGGFRVTDSGDIVIEFYNYNMEATSFTATVTKLDGNYDMALGTNEVSINKGTTVYYLEGLAVGNYELSVANLPAGATISIDGVAVTLNGGKANITISEDQDNRGLVTVMFMSDAAAKLTVTVTPENVMKFNEAITITTDGDYYNTASYIYLEAGTYAIQLSTPDGMYASVTANGEDAITYGGKMGVFTVAQSGNVALRFTVNNYSGVNAFKAIVTNVAGAMTLGKEESISLTASEFGKVYTMSGLAYGEYNVTVSANVKVYVNGSLLEGDSFYLYDNTCTIAFVSDVDVEFTAKVTPAYMLKLGEKTDVTIYAWNYSTTYYMELEEGEYIIELTMSDGTMIKVSVDGELVLNYGDITGSVIVDGGYIAFTFETNTFEEVTFSVLVKAAE